MSRMQAYTIGADSRVADSSSLTIRNAWTIAPAVWRSLQEKYLPGGDFDPAPLFRHLPKMEPQERIALLVTSDGAWVTRENFQVVRDALLWFHMNHRSPNSNLAALADWFDTIPGTEIGACFYMTSVTENPWRILECEDEADCDDFKDRPFDFSQDQLNGFGVQPLEVVCAAAL